MQSSFYNAQKILLGLCVLIASAAQAQSDLKPLSTQGWQHLSWTGRDGAPTGIMAMEQTPDGILWLGSRQGLYRFDGLRFTRVSAVDESPWSPADIYALKVLPNGDLWIGEFVGGAVRLRKGQVTHFRDGLPKAGVTQFLLDKNDGLWASTTAGLAHFDGDRFHPVGPEAGLPSGISVTAIVDGAGNLLVRTTQVPGLFVLKPGAKTFLRLDDGLSGYLPFARDSHGIAWESSKDTLYRISPSTLKPEKVAALSYDAFAPDIRVDPGGGFWLTERGYGVRHLVPPAQDRTAATEVAAQVFGYTEQNGLTSNQAMSNFVDREGDLWVGTERGLDRFHAAAVTRIDSNLGSAYIGVQPSPDGRLWMTAFTGGTWVRSPEGDLQPQAAMPRSLTKITSLASDGANGLWIASRDGIGKLSPARWSLLPLSPEMVGRSITSLVYRDGKLWAAVDRLGVACWNGQTWQLIQGTTGKSITSLAVTPHDLYVGTRDGLLLRGPLNMALKEVKTQEIAQPSLGAITVLTAAGDMIWLGGDKGVGLWQNASFHQVPLQSNPMIYRVSGLIVTPAGDLWINTAVGIARAAASMVREVLEGKAPTAQLQLYDATDGVEGTPLRSFLTPTAVALPNGKLVFTTQLGVYQMDPSRLTTRTLSPAPTVRTVRADGESVSLDNPPLRPHIHTLAIDYGSASLRDAQRLTYRYQLQGYDRQWQSAGNRTTAVYTDLPPGNYTFVSQSSFDGVNWSDSSQPLDLKLPPAFFQRTSVRIAAVLILFSGMWIYLRSRLMRIYELAQMRLQERVQERERIARDLHDTLLQSVQGLILRFGAIADSGGCNATQRDNMQQALVLAEAVITEGRDRVRDLRKQSEDADRLEESLMEVGTILSLSSKTCFHGETQGRKMMLHPIITDELFMIGRQALENAFQHAEAKNLFLRLVYTPREFTMVIRDDGKGMPQGDRIATKEGHWGLAGMRERAMRIGGHLTVASTSGEGCTVTLVVAASIAYRDHLASPGAVWVEQIRARLSRRTGEMKLPG